MAKRDYLLLFKNMLEAASKNQLYIENFTFKFFCEDDKTTDAIVRNFAILGEAANRIHPDYRTKYPQVPWNQIRGSHNRTIHQNFGIDYEIIRPIINSNISKLTSGLKEIVESLNPNT